MDKVHKLTVGKRVVFQPDKYDAHVLLCEWGATDRVLFCAIVHREFNQHHPASGPTNDMSQMFTKANMTPGSPSVKTCQQILDEVHRKYNRSALLDAKSKVAEVKSTMHDNINQALANVEQLNDLDAKTQRLEQSARQFESNAQTLRCHFCKQYWKTIALIVFIILAIIGIVVGVIVAKNK